MGSLDCRHAVESCLVDGNRGIERVMLFEEVKKPFNVTPFRLVALKRSRPLLGSESSCKDDAELIPLHESREVIGELGRSVEEESMLAHGSVWAAF